MEKLKTLFVCGLVSRSFVLSISESTFRRLGLPNRGFRKEGIAKNDFSLEFFFYGFRGRCVSFFGGLGSRFFLVYWALQTGLKIEDFLVM